ncbi:MAG: hypothetical protein ACKO8V_00660, partial [Actinomycetota bacterium]
TETFAWRHATEVEFGTMLAAVPWHWWLGAGLLIAGIGAVLGVVVGYIGKVEKQKYPSRAQRRAEQTNS